MTKEEMLRKSGLTEAEFRELVHKFKGFLNSLNPAQREAVDRWLPTAEKVAASFGPAITAEHLTKNLGIEGFSPTAAAQSGIGLGASDPPPPTP